MLHTVHETHMQLLQVAERSAMQSGLMTITLVLQAFLAAETVAGVLLTVTQPLLLLCHKSCLQSTLVQAK
jgi:hypothetical protein